MNHLLEERLGKLLARRYSQGSLRQPLQLGKNSENFADFASNDYLGLAKDKSLMQCIEQSYKNIQQLGATGSRLLTGNHWLVEELEEKIANFHESKNALLFNSGYDANIGWLPALSRKTDLILYDAAIHASLHDAMQLAQTPSFPFHHNNAEHLEQLLADYTLAKSNRIIFVLVESVYSMDGDIAPLQKIVEICEKYNAILFVDEAHSHGVFGNKGEGLAQSLNLHKKIPLRLHTFGKAAGMHGAVLLCDNIIKSYCLNYARSLIYTTGLDIHTLISIDKVYDLLPSTMAQAQRNKLFSHIPFLKKIIQEKGFDMSINNSPIQFIAIGNNQKAKALSAHLLQHNIDARPILAPTVAIGKEGLRICLHAYNTTAEIEKLINIISNFK